MLEQLIDSITEMIEARLPKVEALCEVKALDEALYLRLDAQIGARVAEAQSEAILALFKILDTNPTLKRTTL